MKCHYCHIGIQCPMGTSKKLQDQVRHNKPARLIYHDHLCGHLCTLSIVGDN